MSQNVTLVIHVNVTDTYFQEHIKFIQTYAMAL